MATQKVQNPGDTVPRAEFRTLGENGRKNAPPIRDTRTGPLILLKGDGSLLWGKEPRQKDAMVAEFDEGKDTLLWIWPGKFSSDVFKLTREDLEACYGGPVPGQMMEFYIMWACSTLGFYSIVTTTGRKFPYQVRACVRADLVRLRQAIGAPRLRIIRTPDADYEFRMLVSARTLRAVFAALYATIEYGNFKAAVLMKQGPEREQAYAEVWSVLRRRLDGRLRGAAVDDTFLRS